MLTPRPVRRQPRPSPFTAGEDEMLSVKSAGAISREVQLWREASLCSPTLAPAAESTIASLFLEFVLGGSLADEVERNGAASRSLGVLKARRDLSLGCVSWMPGDELIHYLVLVVEGDVPA